MSVGIGAGPGGDLDHGPFAGKLPHMPGQPWGRFVVRKMYDLTRKRLISATGLEHVSRERDPFVLVANHSQRAEAVGLPALVAIWRGGDQVRFLADWPMMLVPGIGEIYRVGRVIPVFGKSPKVKPLARLRPYYQRKHPGTAWERAAAHLRAGGCVGSFPEGTVNRHPRRLLRGRTGAARLAVEQGVPIVPVGIRFPEHDSDHPIPDRARMTIEIGPPIEASDPVPRAPASRVREMHARIMQELSRLSGKEWRADAPRDRAR